MYEYIAKVVRIVDGDTVDVLVDLGFHISIEIKLRLYGLNAPELKEEAGKTTRDYLFSRLYNKTVTIKTVKDRQEKYGRYLATIILDGENINEDLLNKGYAVKYMV
jgi:micrococcal nuclease